MPVKFLTTAQENCVDGGADTGMRQLLAGKNWSLRGVWINMIVE